MCSSDLPPSVQPNRSGVPPISLGFKVSRQHQVGALLVGRHDLHVLPLHHLLISFSIERFSKEMTWSLPHLLDGFSLFSSIFALLDPNFMACFRRRAGIVRSSSTAARHRNSFLPISPGKVKFALSQTCKEFRKETTFSFRKGDLAALPC